MHFSGQIFLNVGVRQSHGSVEFLKPCWVRGLGGRPVFGERNLAKLGVEVFLTEFVNIHLAADLDVIPSLYNIDTVEHVKKTLSFQGDGNLTNTKN